MKKRSKVAVIYANTLNYPDKSELFRPSVSYPEYLFEELSQQDNFVYDAVRQAFFSLGYDKENYNTKDWNPFKSVIIPGNYVLVKPNMVMDVNRNPQGDDSCLYTDPSIVAAIIDYIIIALKGTGKIVIGDAPMQECNFDNLIEKSGYKLLIDYYRDKGIDIEIVDFRELQSVVKNGIHVTTLSDKISGKVINLDKNSEFYGECPDKIQNMRITNYDPSIMQKHHNSKKHEYYISNYALKADVVINIPKPKCHRKAGMTASLKNFIGINVRKEYLPHHTKGSKDIGGDEYDKKNFVHDVRSSLLDTKNKLEAEKKYGIVQIYRCCIKLCSLILKIQKNDTYHEGSWYGNQTIPKTILDINKIINYADKNGILREQRQRKIFIVGDMIISGEKEGPVFPTPKEVGIIVMGDNPVAFDKTIATLMGFDYKKIPTIVNAEQYKGCYDFVSGSGTPQIISNMIKYNGKKIDNFTKADTFRFHASSGWKGHIEL